MLLPYCTNGVGPFQQKPWSMALGQSPFPITPLQFQSSNSQIGSGAFRFGPCISPVVSPFHHVLGQRALPRPPFFPALHLAATIRPYPGVQKAKISPLQPGAPSSKPTPTPTGESIQCKKIKLFRPWDDGTDAVSRTARTSPSLVSSASSSTSSTQLPGVGLKKLDDLLVSTPASISREDKPKPMPPIQVDEAEQSKSAFEVFATNLGKSPDGHRCIYCGKMYSRKYGLKIHLRTHTGFKPLKCKVCQRPFGDPSNLNKHVRLHADVLMLSSASEISPLKKQLGDHVEAGGHTPNEHSSDQCAYQQHQISIFKCPFCGRSLVRKRDLERHLASRHPNEHLIDVERL